MNCFVCILVLQCTLCIAYEITGESSKVSPKLDFESTDKVTQTGETSPKIHGVRVIVDTSNSKKSVESRSSEEEPQMSNKGDKKFVGIRTDITFELSDDVKNSTAKKNQDAESIDEDDIIPVFEGHGNVHHESKSRGDNYRRWDMINIPVFHGTDDEPNRIGGGGDWVRFTPITSVWTTERNNYLSNRDYQRQFKTDINPHISQKSWKPCLCNSDPVGFKGNTDTRRRTFVPTTKRVRIDDKLDRTFPDEVKSKK